MRYLRPLLLTLVTLGFLVMQGNAAEIKTAFAVITYADESLLKTFNKKVGRRRYGFGFSQKNSSTAAKIARKQTDQLIGRVQEILDMRPNGLHFTIEILATPKQIQQVYFKEYGRTVDFIAFYSPRSETIYFAANKLQRTVIAHEIAHAVIDRYFDKAPPVKVHELLAQYVEKQL